MMAPSSSSAGSAFSREANWWFSWTLWAKAARSTGSASGLGEGLLLSGLGAQEASRVRHSTAAVHRETSFFITAFSLK